MTHWQSGGNRRRLLQDVDDRKAVFHVDGHEQPRHDRKVKGRVAFVAVAEIGDRVLGPLIRLGQQHAARERLVDVVAQFLEKRVRLGQVLAVGPFPLVKIGDRVEPHAVDAHPQPEIAAPRRPPRCTCGIVEIQIGLMGVEAVPVVGLGHRIPGPVRVLEILEDDPGVCVFVPACRSRRRNRARGCRARPAGHAGTRDADPRCD